MDSGLSNDVYIVKITHNYDRLSGQKPLWTQGGLSYRLNTPWVLGNHKPMLKFGFDFALSQEDQNWYRSDGYPSQTNNGVKLINNVE